jgi:hypothetical protein
MRKVFLGSVTVLITTILSGCGGGGGAFVSTNVDAPTGGGSTTDPSVPIATYSTDGVLCDYAQNIFNSDESVNTTSDAGWVCSANVRSLNANGVPDHEVGTFPNANNPNAISQQNVQVEFPLEPAVVSEEGVSVKVTGYALNGVKFDPGTGGSCSSDSSSCSVINPTGDWNIEALGQTAFDFGEDMNNAHVQPDGAYHYHGMPEAYLDLLAKGEAMTLVGWTVDGFPFYARYGYTVADDSTSAIKILDASWRVKSVPDAGRPSTDLYAMGTFRQDYEYVDGLGDLDECNGRTGVTPEFPEGIYYLVVTETYPYVGRCLKGEFDEEMLPPPM